MAINYELINKGGISLGTNFELLSEKPLDSRLVVPSLEGLQNYIDSAAAYEGMIAYVSSEKKHYEVKVIDGVLSYRQFGLTTDELNQLIINATTAAMEFKGATATLPENPAKGDMYKVAGENISIKIDDVDAKLGDSIVYDGEKWFLIPSGDDIEDTWRPVDGVNNEATLKFVDGDKTVAAVAADGTIKYNHATIASPADVTADGDEKTRTYITAVETDGYGHITGYKTATENVEDNDTTYEFECAAEHSNVYFTVKEKLNGEDVAEHTVCVDAYSKNEIDTLIEGVEDKIDSIDYSNFKTKQEAYSAAGDVKKTVTNVEQNENGELTVTYGDIDFTHNHDTQYKKLQTPVELPEGENLGQGYDFVYAVTQDEQGVITTHSTSVNLNDYVHIRDLGASVDSLVQDIENLDGGSYFDSLESLISRAYNVELASDANRHAIETLVASVEATENPLEFKVKHYGEGYEDETITLVAPDTGVMSITAGDASVTVGGTATAPTVAAKISAAEGNALTLAEDGLKVIIPESTKVEASETNGNIKVDGEEVTVYTHPESHTAAEISDFAIEVAKVKVDEAIKATQDGNGKVIADTYAEKATTLAGYGIGDAYTKKEVADQDAVVLSEAQKYADGKVSDLAKTVYTQEEVNILIAQAHTWGEF